MSNDTTLQIGERIKQVRQYRGYSQAQAAEILGISQQAYAEKEKSGADLRISSLLEICKAFEVDPGIVLSTKLSVNQSNLDMLDTLDLNNQKFLEEFIALKERIQKMKIIIQEQRSMVDQLSS